jgi:atypical dual specificity phosphatase
MPSPDHFSWIDRPRLSASAYPDGPDELAWLRKQGIEVVLSLTEAPLRRDWVDNAGLMSVHVPVEDFDAPTPEQFDKCVSVIASAHRANMGVHIHCRGGAGRTGRRVRQLRPGSIETPGQEEALAEYARRRNAPRDD